MIHAFIVAALVSVRALAPSPVVVLPETTIVVDAPEPTAWIVCEEGETSRRCGTFVADTIEEAMGAARSLIGQGVTLSAKVSR